MHTDTQTHITVSLTQTHTHTHTLWFISVNPHIVILMVLVKDLCGDSLWSLVIKCISLKQVSVTRTENKGYVL